MMWTCSMKLSRTRERNDNSTCAEQQQIADAQGATFPIVLREMGRDAILQFHLLLRTSTTGRHALRKSGAAVAPAGGNTTFFDVQVPLIGTPDSTPPGRSFRGNKSNFGPNAAPGGRGTNSFQGAGGRLRVAEPHSRCPLSFRRSAVGEYR